MKKLVFLCIVAAFCVSSAVYGKAVRDANGVYTYRCWGDPRIDPNLAWDTINDWVKVGNMSYDDSNYAGHTYADYISLWSQTDIAEDTILDPSMHDTSAGFVAGFEDRCDLIMYADMGPVGSYYWVPVGTWAGYKWTVPDMNESIVSIQISGFGGFAPIFSELQVVDDTNTVIGNYLSTWFWGENQWFHSHPDFDPTGSYFFRSYLPQTPTVEFPVNGSKSVTLRYYMRGNWWPYPQVPSSAWDHKVWTGNAFWIYLPRIRTVMEPKCGEGNDLPKPQGDLNSDCKVDFKDMTLLAANWMVNGQFTAPAATDDLQQQCGGGYDHLYPRIRSVGDLNSDCIVDFKDMQRFVETWLVDNQ